VFVHQSLHIFIAVATVLLVFVVMLLRRNAPTEILFIFALAVFVATGVISPEDAWQSFSDPAVIAIGGLLVVSAALRTTGLLDYLGRSLLGNVKTEAGALTRLSSVVIVGSAFLLNTAIVAMLLPLVISWCRRMHVAPSKLLLTIS
jgi:Na+/H+ antiporter NhaD/arsenite permease-like protein